MSRDQRSVGSHPGGGGGEVDCDFQRGKGLWQKWLKKNIYYSYILTCPTVFFFSFLFTLLLKLLISFVLWNLIKVLSFLIFLIALFILVTNLCLHAGLFLEFSFLFSFSPSFSNLKILNLLLFFSKFITLFAFPTVPFPLNAYKSVNSS